MNRFFLTIAASIVSLQSLAAPSSISDVLKEPLCFGREYSGAHMNGHPNQTVRQMKVKLFNDSRIHPESVALELSVEVKKTQDSNGQSFHSYSAYTTSMHCKAEDRTNLVCSIECDGGGSAVLKWDQTRSAQSVVFVNGGILVSDCEELEDRVFLPDRSGGDDSFKLVALPNEYCQ